MVNIISHRTITNLKRATTMLEILSSREPAENMPGPEFNTQVLKKITPMYYFTPVVRQIQLKNKGK